MNLRAYYTYKEVVALISGVKDDLATFVTLATTIKSNVGDDHDSYFLLEQFRDPENNRPVRPLGPKADRTKKLELDASKSTVNTWVTRPVKDGHVRGEKKPGKKTIKKIATTLLPEDGRMHLYNHAAINKGHLHTIWGFAAPKENAKSGVDKPKDESCIIVACFQSDAGTNTRFWIEGQALNEHHNGVYPKAISLSKLLEHNKAFYKKLQTKNPKREPTERNEVLAKPSTEAIRFVAAVEDTRIDRLNALHKKYLIQQTLEIEGIPLDVPALIISPITGYKEYPLTHQIYDILNAHSETEQHLAEMIANQIIALEYDSRANTEIKLAAYERQTAFNKQIIKILTQKIKQTPQFFSSIDAIRTFLISDLFDEKSLSSSSEIYDALHNIADNLTKKLASRPLNGLNLARELNNEIDKKINHYKEQEEAQASQKNDFIKENKLSMNRIAYVHNILVKSYDNAYYPVRIQKHLSIFRKARRTGISLFNLSLHPASLYSSFLKSQHRLPTEASLSDFVEYALLANKQNTKKVAPYSANIESIIANKNNVGSVKEQVLARQIWTNIVSTIDQESTEALKKPPTDDAVSVTIDGNGVVTTKLNVNPMIEKIMQRLEGLGFKNQPNLYKDCIEMLKTHSAVVFTFNASFLKKDKLSLHQPLNIWESNNKTEEYQKSRKKAELGMFKYLEDYHPDLYKNLIDNKSALPRYAALMLIDKKNGIKALQNYGSSYAVLNDLIKLNSVYIPSNPIGNSEAGRNYAPASFFNLEILLLQLPDNFLKALANWCITGELGETYQEKFPIEVMIPAINLLDEKTVQLLHISENEYELKPAEINLLKDKGLTLSITENLNAYDYIVSCCIENIKKNELETLKRELKSFPTIRYRLVKPEFFGFSALANSNKDFFELFLHQATCKATLLTLRHAAWIRALVCNKLDFVELFCQKTGEQFMPDKVDYWSFYHMLAFAISNQLNTRVTNLVNFLKKDKSKFKEFFTATIKDIEEVEADAPDTLNYTTSQACKLKVGDKLFVCDTMKAILLSTVLAVIDDQIQIHYEGWSATWDEWISFKSSDGLARLFPIKAKKIIPSGTVAEHCLKLAENKNDILKILLQDAEFINTLPQKTPSDVLKTRLSLLSVFDKENFEFFLQEEKDPSLLERFKSTALRNAILEYNFEFLESFNRHMEKMGNNIQADFKTMDYYFFIYHELLNAIKNQNQASIKNIMAFLKKNPQQFTDFFSNPLKDFEEIEVDLSNPYNLEQANNLKVHDQLFIRDTDDKVHLSTVVNTAFGGISIHAINWGKYITKGLSFKTDLPLMFPIKMRYRTAQYSIAEKIFESTLNIDILEILLSDANFEKLLPEATVEEVFKAHPDLIRASGKITFALLLKKSFSNMPKVNLSSSNLSDKNNFDFLHLEDEDKILLKIFKQRFIKAAISQGDFEFLNIFRQYAGIQSKLESVDYDEIYQSLSDAIKTDKLAIIKNILDFLKLDMQQFQEFFTLNAAADKILDLSLTHNAVLDMLLADDDYKLLLTKQKIEAVSHTHPHLIERMTIINNADELLQVILNLIRFARYEKACELFSTHVLSFVLKNEDILAIFQHLLTYAKLESDKWISTFTEKLQKPITMPNLELLYNALNHDVSLDTNNVEALLQSCAATPEQLGAFLHKVLSSYPEKSNKFINTIFKYTKPNLKQADPDYPTITNVLITAAHHAPHMVIELLKYDDSFTNQELGAILAILVLKEKNTEALALIAHRPTLSLTEKAPLEENTALITACQAKAPDEKLVRALCRKTDVQVSDEKDSTALSIAVGSPHANKLLPILLQHATFTPDQIHNELKKANFTTTKLIVPYVGADHIGVQDAIQRHFTQGMETCLAASDRASIAKNLVIFWDDFNQTLGKKLTPEKLNQHYRSFSEKVLTNATNLRIDYNKLYTTETFAEKTQDIAEHLLKKNWQQALALMQSARLKTTPETVCISCLSWENKNQFLTREWGHENERWKLDWKLKNPTKADTLLLTRDFTEVDSAKKRFLAGNPDKAENIYDMILLSQNLDKFSSGFDAASYRIKLKERIQDYSSFAMDKINTISQRLKLKPTNVVSGDEKYLLSDAVSDLLQMQFLCTVFDDGKAEQFNFLKKRIEISDHIKQATNLLETPIHGITEQQLNDALSNYHKNKKHLCGITLFQSEESNQIISELKNAYSDERRYEIAKDYLILHPNKAFAQALTAETQKISPELVTKAVEKYDSYKGRFFRTIKEPSPVSFKAFCALKNAETNEQRLAIVKEYITKHPKKAFAQAIEAVRRFKIN